MERINPGALIKSLLFVLATFGSFILFSQEVNRPVVVRYSHPVLNKVNKLVDAHNFKEAIDISLEKARQMKSDQDWEGYMNFMVRAAEIETFEVWKSRGSKKSNIIVDYRRPLKYLDSLERFAGSYLNDYPYVKANALFTNAVVNYWLSMPDEALRMHIQALGLRAKIFGTTSQEVADSYLWLGFLYTWGIPRKDMAKQFYLKALELQKKYMPASRYSLGSTYYGLSIIARENFDFDEAEAMSKEYSSLYHDLPYELGLSYQLFANIYSAQGNFEKAIELRQAGINIHEASSHTEDLIIEFSDLATDYKNLGRYQAASEALNKGLSILKSSKNKDTFYTGVLYQKFGEIYTAMENYDSAEHYFNKALNVVTNHFGPHNNEVADVYGSRGNFFVAKKEYETGLADLQRMLVAVIPNFRPKDVFSLPTIQKENEYFPTIIQAHFSKGDAFFTWYSNDKDKKKLESALDCYRAAYNQLMVARNNINDEISKPFLMMNFEKSIERSIQCAKNLYTATKDKSFFEDIFHFIELTKYMNVLDALQRAERANNSNIPKHLFFKLDNIKNDLTVIQKRIRSTSLEEKDSLAKLNNEILSLVQQRRELIEEISRYPDYNAVNLDSMVLNVDDIHGYLSDDEQILEYFWGTDSVYILSLTDQSREVKSVHRTTDVDTLFSTAYRYLSGAASYESGDIKKYSVVSSRLYELFLKPLIKKRKLTIIPDGPFNLLSVESLVVDDNPKNDSYKKLDYLIYHNEVGYAYSASILFQNYKSGKKKIDNVLAFSYSSNDASSGLALRSGYTELPGTFRELETLSRLFKNVRSFTNTEASKSNFINNSTGYDIIHLAVHGIGDQEVADNSRLIFRGDSTDSEALYAFEIYNLKLDADLMVLSACESGIGRNQTGEGMFSIARAFTYAGCPSLVISRWRVNDTFTAEIMTEFYETLNHGESISSSLRHAKLKFLKESDDLIAHPSNWSAFVVNGQNLAFKSKSRPVYLIYLFAALICAVVFTLYIRKKM